MLDGYQIQHLKNQSIAKDLTHKLWLSVNRGYINQKLLDSIAIESRRIVADIRKAVMDLFPLVGIKGAQKDEELNIVFRNICTATQHSLLNLPL